MQARMVIAVGLLAAGCAAHSPEPATPAETTRHRAALASVTVVNESAFALTIAFRTAMPPLQEVVIGRVSAAGRARTAPIPAGEPIILVARRPDGAEFLLSARSFALDAEFVWDIPKDAKFLTPERRK